MDGESRATVTPTVGDKPKRQPNFSPSDIEVLVNAVEEEKGVICGSFVGSAGGVERKARSWSKITAKWVVYHFCSDTWQRQ